MLLISHLKIYLFFHVAHIKSKKGRVPEWYVMVCSGYMGIFVI